MAREKDQVELEAELFATIATLDTLTKSLIEGDLDPTLYKRQLRSLMRDAFKAHMNLDKMNFNMDTFVKKEKIIEKYPYGAERLRLAEGTMPSMPTSDEVPVATIGPSFVSVSNIAAKTADVVANMIELIDLAKLRSVARIDLIVPNLDDILLLLENFPGFGKDYWVYIEIERWRDNLKKESPDKVIDEKTAKNLEYNAARWLNDFRRRLRE
ncbi:MAG: hypothetical protein ACFFCD_02740 [Promethearchaeota archaeon]